MPYWPAGTAFTSDIASLPPFRSLSKSRSGEIVTGGYEEGFFCCHGYKPWQDNIVRVCRMLAETGIDEIRLDELGSFAWRRLDGATKVRSLAVAMREAFPDSRHQLEERLGAYLRAMRRLHLIAFPDWDKHRG